jgi:hypothetical protein
MKSIILIAVSAGTAHASLGGGAPSPATTQAPAPMATSAPAPSATASSDTGPSGFELGFQLGNQWPGGDLAKDAPLGDVTSSGVMLGFDIGQRVSRRFFWGWQFSEGYLSPSMQFCTGCSLHDLRSGLLFRIYPQFDLPRVWQPYLGLGVNFDMLSASAPGVDTEHVFGVECADISVGADFVAAPKVSVGAYVSTAFAIYIGTDHDTLGAVQLHEWFTLGLRGAFTL